MEYVKSICQCYAKTWLDHGAYEVHVKMCSTGYLQGFAMRSLCAGYRVLKDPDYLEAARQWALFTVRLQGTQGHPDAYNMGYLTTVKQGVPAGWYPADCGDILLAILNVAAILPPNDPDRQRLLDSAKRHTDYVLAEWSLPDGGVGAYVEDFKVYKQKFWCADGRMCAALWGWEELHGDGAYRKRALELTRCCIDEPCLKPDPKTSGASYNASYGIYIADAVCMALAHLDERETELRAAALGHLRDRFIPWAIQAQSRLGFWNSGYHGMLLNNLVEAQRHAGAQPGLQSAIDRAFVYAEDDLGNFNGLEGIMKWGRNTGLGLAFAARVDPRAVFPWMS